MVGRIAAAYLAERGELFSHAGVHLPLSNETLELAIHNNMTEALIEYGIQKGRANAIGYALEMLGHMMNGDRISAFGAGMLDDMNSMFCAEVRRMLEDGKDPVTELACLRLGRLVQ